MRTWRRPLRACRQEVRARAPAVRARRHGRHGAQVSSTAVSRTPCRLPLRGRKLDPVGQGRPPSSPPMLVADEIRSAAQVVVDELPAEQHLATLALDTASFLEVTRSTRPYDLWTCSQPRTVSPGPTYAVSSPGPQLILSRPVHGVDRVVPGTAADVVVAWSAVDDIVSGAAGEAVSFPGPPSRTSLPGPPPILSSPGPP